MEKDQRTIDKIEIAYCTFDRNGAFCGWKRKIVASSKLERELASMHEKGYEIYGTRTVE